MGEVGCAPFISHLGNSKAPGGLCKCRKVDEERADCRKNFPNGNVFGRGGMWKCKATWYHPQAARVRARHESSDRSRTDGESALLCVQQAET